MKLLTNLACEASATTERFGGLMVNKKYPDGYYKKKTTGNSGGKMSQKHSYEKETVQDVLSYPCLSYR